MGPAAWAPFRPRDGPKQLAAAPVRAKGSATSTAAYALARGRHADMSWFARQREVRRDPRARAPWARTAMVLAVPPVETKAIPRAARDVANSTNPVLSETERSARRTGCKSVMN